MVGPPGPSGLHDLLIAEALAAGFPLAGSVDLDPALAGPFAEDVDRFDRWIAQGYDGAMSYLARGRDRRANPRLVFPSTESVFCVAIPYSRLPGGSPMPESGPRHARYLDGPDYHLELTARLDAMLERVAANLEGPPLTWKVCVDTSAVLERSWAALAGLGWIGKNTLLIHPKHGSYLFVAEALLSRPTGQAPAPLPDLCGHCTRCLVGCPTQAFTGPRVLDANRCLSYWTLEKRGPLEISEKDRKSMGTWIAGCDVCQEVCPFNFKAARAAEAEAQVSGDPRPRAMSWIELLDESEEQYVARVKNSALKRVKPPQFRRNLAIALANAASAPDSAQAIAALAPRIRAKSARETDPSAIREWERCLSALTDTRT